MFRSLSPWVLAAVLLLATFEFTHGARAQAPQGSGERIRVGIQGPVGVQPFIGTLARASDDSIVVYLENGRLFSVPMTRVHYVAVSGGRSSITLAQSAAAGAGAVGAATALALFARRQLDGQTDSSQERPWLAIGMAAGAVPGALIGLAVGALLRRERWRRIPMSELDPATR